MKTRLWLALTALAVVLPNQALSSGKSNINPQKQQEAQMIQLEITGEEGTQFTYILTARHNGETLEQHKSGSVPEKSTLYGDHVHLEVTQTSEGSLSVELKKAGNRSTSRVANIGSRVRLTVN